MERGGRGRSIYIVDDGRLPGEPQNSAKRDDSAKRIPSGIGEQEPVITCVNYHLRQTQCRTALQYWTVCRTVLSTRRHVTRGPRKFLTSLRASLESIHAKT